MAPETWSEVGAAALGAAASVALVVVLVGLGLDRPTGRRARTASLAVLLLAGVGFLASWLAEVRAGARTDQWVRGSAEVAVAAGLVAFAVGVVLDALEAERWGRASPPEGRSS